MKKRYMELDILRGLAIVGVLLIHITARLVQNETSISLLVNQASRFAVPAFIFLSGLGLTLTNKLDKGYFIFLKNQISKLLVLYIGWSFVYYTVGTDSFSLSQFFEGLILGSNHYHLYYVPLIITFYLFYPSLLKIGRSHIGLIITLGITIISQVVNLGTDSGLLNDNLNIFSWLFYFVLGIWFATNFDQKLQALKKRGASLTVLTALTLAGIYIESFFLMDLASIGSSTASTRPSIILFSVLFIMMVFSWSSVRFKPFLSKLSKHSYGIYLSHVFILELYVDWYAKMGLPDAGLSYILISFVIIVAASALIAFALSKLIKQGTEFMSRFKYSNGNTLP